MLLLLVLVFGMIIGVLTKRYKTVNGSTGIPVEPFSYLSPYPLIDRISKQNYNTVSCKISRFNYGSPTT